MYFYQLPTLANLSISSGVVPKEMKVARVCPIFKKNSRLDVGNNRPVRDRPFNLQGGGGVWFFVSFRIFFRITRELEYLFFFVAQSAKFFSRIYR
jgi:hypothetical protein